MDVRHESPTDEGIGGMHAHLKGNVRGMFPRKASPRDTIPVHDYGDKVDRLDSLQKIHAHSSAETSGLGDSLQRIHTLSSTETSGYGDTVPSPTGGPDPSPVDNLHGNNPRVDNTMDLPLSHNPGGHNPGGHNPGGHNPGGHNPGGHSHSPNPGRRGQGDPGTRTSRAGSQERLSQDDRYSSKRSLSSTRGHWADPRPTPGERRNSASRVETFSQSGGTDREAFDPGREGHHRHHRDHHHRRHHNPGGSGAPGSGTTSGRRGDPYLPRRHHMSDGNLAALGASPHAARYHHGRHHHHHHPHPHPHPHLEQQQPGPPPTQPGPPPTQPGATQGPSGTTARSSTFDPARHAPGGTRSHSRVKGTGGGGGSGAAGGGAGYSGGGGPEPQPHQSTSTTGISISSNNNNARPAAYHGGPGNTYGSGGPTTTPAGRTAGSKAPGRRRTSPPDPAGPAAPPGQRRPSTRTMSRDHNLSSAAIEHGLDLSLYSEGRAPATTRTRSGGGGGGPPPNPEIVIGVGRRSPDSRRGSSTPTETPTLSQDDSGRFLGVHSNSTWLTWSQDRRNSFKKRLDNLEQQQKEMEKTRVSTPVRKARKESVMFVSAELESQHVLRDDESCFGDTSFGGKPGPKDQKPVVVSTVTMPVSSKRRKATSKEEVKLTVSQWNGLVTFWEHNVFVRCRYGGTLLSLVALLLTVTSVTNQDWFRQTGTSPTFHYTLLYQKQC